MVTDMVTLVSEDEKVIEAVIKGISIDMVDDMRWLEAEYFRDNGTGESLGGTIFDIRAFGS